MKENEPEFKDLRVNTKVGDIDNLNIPEISSAVINLLNSIEKWMGLVITFYFKPREESEFVDFVMNSSITPFSSKAKLLRSLDIINDDEFSSLMQLANIRNGFAHSIIYEVNDEVERKKYHSIKVLNNKGSIEYKEIKEQYDFFYEKADTFLYFFSELYSHSMKTNEIISISALKKELNKARK